MPAHRVAPLLALVFSFLSPTLCAQATHPQDPQPDQTIAVLVTTAVGAPTADELVQAYRDGPPAAPSLRGLGVGNPQKIAYLLPVRAEGDALEHLQAHPDSAGALLERYIVVIYPAGTDLDPALAALQMDPYVMAAYKPMPTTFSSASLLHFDVGDEQPADEQYGRIDLNIDAAWQLAGGHALIADIDSGLYPNHAAIRQFDNGGEYLGGNFIPVASLDISLAGLVDPPQNSYDVDERRAMPVTDPACNSDPLNHPNMQPMAAGHGTHTSGLMAANGNANLGVEGTCRHCGIAMWKVAQAVCQGNSSTVVLGINPIAKASALKLSGDIGAQVVSMSFGSSTQSYGPFPTYCQTNPLDPMCLAISHAAYRDIAMVAASGNGRTQLDFPAADPRMIAAGGFEESLNLWDLWPTCPPGFGLTQCGSNFTTVANGARQEVVGAAQSVLSTTYPGYDWNPVLKCGDGFPGPGFGNGTGWCTGTSMAAPQIAGVVGILRSINPLVPTGMGPTVAGTVRKTLASSTFEAQASQPWNSLTGTGIPMRRPPRGRCSARSRARRRAIARRRCFACTAPAPGITSTSPRRRWPSA